MEAISRRSIIHITAPRTATSALSMQVDGPGQETLQPHLKNQHLANRWSSEAIACLLQITLIKKSTDACGFLSAGFYPPTNTTIKSVWRLCVPLYTFWADEKGWWRVDNWDEVDTSNRCKLCLLWLYQGGPTAPWDPSGGRGWSSFPLLGWTFRHRIKRNIWTCIQIHFVWSWPTGTKSSHVFNWDHVPSSAQVVLFNWPSHTDADQTRPQQWNLSYIWSVTAEFESCAIVNDFLAFWQKSESLWV